MPSIAYVISMAFLLESILQWLFLKFLGVSDVLFGNIHVSLVILITSVIAILMYRFTDCPSMPIWMKMIIALILVELTIFGAGAAITFAPVLHVAISVIMIFLTLITLSIVGCHMMAIDTALFVGCLCLCTFCGLMVFVLLLTMFLSMQWQVTYVNCFIMCIYPALFFNVAYDSREMNRPDNESLMSLEDNLHNGLYLYGEFVILLVITLKLIEQ